jgi:hypothetical protein
MTSRGPKELRRCREARPNSHGCSPRCLLASSRRSSSVSSFAQEPASRGSLIQCNFLVVAQLTPRPGVDGTGHTTGRKGASMIRADTQPNRVTGGSACNQLTVQIHRPKW